MEVKTISNETIERIKTLPRIDFYAYMELIKQGHVKRLVKLKTVRTIFFDEETECFLYFNPYDKKFSKCGTFNTDENE